jgi:ferredoxin
MPKKYHVPIKSAPPRFNPIGKYTTIEFREDCAGSCRECVKKKCVYGIFQENYQHMSAMDEPEYLYACQSCFRCVQECTKGIFSRVVNPEYRSLGDDYWQADIIHRTWYQAHTGKIPVSGAGYRGPFIGQGFDSMWTDMSEIVRPTRDGIHGREYINTGIELSRRNNCLNFGEGISIISDPSPIFEIPVPILFRQPEFGVLSENVLQAAARAAFILGTMLLINSEYYSDNLAPYMECLVPRLEKNQSHAFLDRAPGVKMIELIYADGIEQEFNQIRALKPDMIISVGVPLNHQAASRALILTESDVDTIHFLADDRGREQDSSNPRFLKEMIREIHLKLVDHLMRNRVNLVFSGGIALAEHVAKAIICGADGITIDIPLLIALECRLCYRCKEDQACPVKMGNIDPEWGKQRIINLVGAWRNQLLEVMGAMGIREARRLRGEVGRSMWYEDLERENFGPIFGEKKVSGSI